MARNWNGTTDTATLADNTNPTSYTLAIWARPDQLRNQGALGRTTTNADELWASLSFDASGHARHYTYDGAQQHIVGVQVVAVNEWALVVGTAVNGGLSRLFVRGELDGTSLSIGTLYNPGGTMMWRIASGKSDFSWSRFDGDLAYACYWQNTVLSDDLIKRLAAAGPQFLDDIPVRPTWVLPLAGDDPAHESEGFGVLAAVTGSVSADNPPPSTATFDLTGSRVSQFDGELLVAGSTYSRVSKFDGELLVGGSSYSRVSEFGADVFLVPPQPSRFSMFGADIILIAPPSMCFGGTVPTVADPADGIEFSGIGPHGDRIFIELDLD